MYKTIFNYSFRSYTLEAPSRQSTLVHTRIRCKEKYVHIIRYLGNRLYKQANKKVPYSTLWGTVTEDPLLDNQTLFILKRQNNTEVDNIISRITH